MCLHCNCFSAANLRERSDLARLASPVAHLDKNDPPLLLIHGDADPQMPPEQSQEFAKAYEAAGLSVEFITIKGGKHGGAEFYDDVRTQLMGNISACATQPAMSRLSRTRQRQAGLDFEEEI